MDPLLQKQLAIYFTLMSTYHAVEALPYGHVDASALLKRGVVAEPLAAEAADGKTRHREERFFEPMREKEWRDKGHRLADVGPVNRDPDDDEFLAALSVANALQRALTWEATDDGMSVLCGSNYMRIGFPSEMSRRDIHEPLQCRFEDGMYEWRKYMLWAPQDTQKPHLGAVSAHGHVADEHRLLRSEVLLLVRLSMIRIKYGYKLGYVVCPIIMLSVCDTQVRLIQAHFNGAKLVVRFSPLQDFSRAADMTAEKMVPLIRCVAGRAVGDTTTTTVPVKLGVPLSPADCRAAIIKNEIVKAAV